MEVNLLEEATYPRILHAGDSCVVVEFGSTISLDINGQVQSLRRALENKNIPGIKELIPTYRSLAIYFDPLEIPLEKLKSTLTSLSTMDEENITTGGTLIVIPVCYGGELGPDIENVAQHNNLSVEEVIEIHSRPDYYCYMLGFTPGFSYLGGMDERIATPRLETPRTLIPAGSVGIAGKQTGIYPIDSPGGWQLIGRTPLKMFDPKSEKPTLIEAGYWVRFKPISFEEYQSISSEVAKGTYLPEILTKEGASQ
ncbi:5-oxoprolinase subunit PxpB [Thermovirga lienii]|jgi:KipI family sensor histidine kinase inhibitor|uniref:5-oxoprolinase subunit PxpB n=1 Tax=Thermovirga lienii TaxID=336261 RepID=UPI00059C06F8|nr:5-oxoprolinase subunit PxpB [Thermovirga lienii]MDN5319089.1 inhibitor of KinA [Thermovirga sp.]HCD71729.1 allophanate hydrolase subunit 1 [Thermovirga lienii]